MYLQNEINSGHRLTKRVSMTLFCGCNRDFFCYEEEKLLCGQRVEGQKGHLSRKIGSNIKIR